MSNTLVLSECTAEAELSPFHLNSIELVGRLQHWGMQAGQQWDVCGMVSQVQCTKTAGWLLLNPLQTLPIPSACSWGCVTVKEWAHKLQGAPWLQISVPQQPMAQPLLLLHSYLQALHQALTNVLREMGLDKEKGRRRRQNALSADISLLEHLYYV